MDERKGVAVFVTQVTNSCDAWRGAAFSLPPTLFSKPSPSPFSRPFLLILGGFGRCSISCLFS